MKSLSADVERLGIQFVLYTFPEFPGKVFLWVDDGNEVRWPTNEEAALGEHPEIQEAQLELVIRAGGQWESWKPYRDKIMVLAGASISPEGEA